MMLGALAAWALAAANPAVTIDDAAWLGGRWIGEGLGGTVEETWAPPSGGQMVGHFRLLKDGKVDFYELMLLDVTDAGIRMRVKHFHPTFVGWEEKDGSHTFEPVWAAPDELRFKGLILKREGDQLTATVTIRKKDGTVSDFPIVMRRAPL